MHGFMSSRNEEKKVTAKSAKKAQRPNYAFVPFVAEVGAGASVLSEVARPGGARLGREQFYAASQVGECPGLEELTEGEFDVEAVPHPRDDLHGAERVAAQFEEVILDTDRLQSEDFGVEPGQPALDRRARRNELRLQLGPPFVGRGQRPAIHLAVGVERQRVELHERRGHHVDRQACGEVAAQFARPAHLPLFRHEVGYEAAVTRSVFASDNSRLRDVRVRREQRLDLARLDAEAANLDLLVAAPEELNAAIGEEAREVASLVEARARLRRERVGDESLGSERGPIEVAARKPAATDVQSTRNADGHGPQVLV